MREGNDFPVVVGIDHHAWWYVMYTYLYTAKHVGYFGLGDLRSIKFVIVVQRYYIPFISFIGRIKN